MPTASQKTILIRTFKSNKTPVVGLIMAFCVVIIALFAPWISLYDPISQDMNVQHAPPNWSHPFGTDSYGRDQLSRILWGSRVSIEAARAVGQRDGKIMIIHVPPNIFGDILVMGTLWVATAIIVEASLSFTG